MCNNNSSAVLYIKVKYVTSLNIELLYSMIMSVSNVNVTIVIKFNFSRTEEIFFKLTPLTKTSDTVIVTIKDVYTVSDIVNYSPHKISTKNDAINTLFGSLCTSTVSDVAMV